jgi:hypothetical protein
MACPRCGQHLDLESETNCKHLLFTYINEAGEFAYIHDSLSSIRGGLSDDQDPVTEVVNEVEHGLCVEFSATSTGPGISVAWEYSTDDD